MTSVVDPAASPVLRGLAYIRSKAGGVGLKVRGHGATVILFFSEVPHLLSPSYG